MISKFFSKLKSILFKTPVLSESSLKKEKKITKLAKSSKTKTKKVSTQKSIENLMTIPGVGAKSAKALFEAGFKTKKAVIAAKEKELLAHLLLPRLANLGKLSSIFSNIEVLPLIEFAGALPPQSKSHKEEVSRQFQAWIHPL